MWHDTVIVAFSVVNTFRVLAYVPQIVRIIRDQSGAMAVAAATWMLFLLSHLTTVAYALVVANDSRMAAIFLANAACCVLIVALTYWKRWAYQIRTLADGRPTPQAMAWPRLSRRVVMQSAVVMVLLGATLLGQRAYFGAIDVNGVTADYRP